MRVLDLSSASASPTGEATGWAITALAPGTVACLGTFDGMHRGHQGLIARARALGERVAVVTFEPRPVEVLAPDHSPPRLQTPGQREHVCRELGVDTLVILPFNLEVSRLSPGEFVTQFLIEGLRPASVVVGYDFHFGARRSGGPTDLQLLLEPAGVPVAIVDKISAPAAELGADKLGSTAIRELVSAGEVARATELLGRLYAVAGVVAHGAARGRELGYPTANVTSASLHPAGGVYACFLSLLDASGTRELEHWPAVANLGTNPTFTSTSTGTAELPMLLEVHALDVDLGARLYGRAVEVGFVARLRDERRFDGIESLRQAIAADIEAARPLLGPELAARRFAPVVEADGRPSAPPTRAGAPP